MAEDGDPQLSAAVLQPHPPTELEMFSVYHKTAAILEQDTQNKVQGGILNNYGMINSISVKCPSEDYGGPISRQRFTICVLHLGS